MKTKTENIKQELTSSRSEQRTKQKSGKSFPPFLSSFFILCALCASVVKASAQVSFSPPPVVGSNSVTWVPNPTTNVIIGQLFISQHTIRVQNQNFGATNALSIPFYLSIDGTNRIFYYCNWTVPTNYVPSGTNLSDIITFPATNIPIYASAAICTTNDANTNLQVGIFLVQ